MTARKQARGGEAYIRYNRIYISVDIGVIPNAYQAGIDLRYIEEGFRIVDPKAFAKYLVQALNKEDEQGTTPVHRLFDKCMDAAIEQGAEGVIAVGKEDE